MSRIGSPHAGMRWAEKPWPKSAARSDLTVVLINYTMENDDKECVVEIHTNGFPQWSSGRIEGQHMTQAEALMYAATMMRLNDAK